MHSTDRVVASMLTAAAFLGHRTRNFLYNPPLGSPPRYISVFEYARDQLSFLPPGHSISPVFFFDFTRSPYPLDHGHKNDREQFRFERARKKHPARNRRVKEEFGGKKRFVDRGYFLSSTRALDRGSV